MRVSQVRHLAWAGNGLVFLGMAFVVHSFLGVRGRPAAPEVKWPEAKGVADPTRSRWPPQEIAAFKDLWAPFWNGFVPEPPRPPAPVEVKKDLAAEFRRDTRYVAGLEVVNAPWRSVAQVNYQGKNQTLEQGAFVGDWQFVSYRTEIRKDPKSGEDVRISVLRFVNPSVAEPVTIEQDPRSMEPFTKPPLVQPIPDPSNPFAPPAVQRDRIDGPAAWCDPLTGEWWIPASEQRWWERYGEEMLPKSLKTVTEKDARGTPRGMRIVSQPAAGTPLRNSHGLSQGDVVRAINGVPVTSIEDAIRYLRGPGRGLPRYQVLVENQGRERTVTYNVPR